MSSSLSQINIRVANNSEEVEEFAKLGHNEGWNMSTVDLVSYYELSPSGWIVAEMNGIPVGRLYATHYPSCGHIGFVIVAKDKRGGGIGRKLLDHAISVSLKGCPIVALYSGREEIPFYSSLGFSVREFVLRFWLTKDKDTAMTIGISNVKVDEGSKDELAAYDAELSGSYRPGFWKLYGDGETFPTSNCVTVKDNTGKITGLGAIRQVTKTVRLGPLYAKDTKIGEKILKRLLANVEINSIVSCDVFKDNVKWVELLQSFGFVLKDDSVLMVKNPDNEKIEHPSSIHKQQILCINSLDFN